MFTFAKYWTGFLLVMMLFTFFSRLKGVVEPIPLLGAVLAAQAILMGVLVFHFDALTKLTKQIKSPEVSQEAVDRLVAAFKYYSVTDALVNLTYGIYCLVFAVSSLIEGDMVSTMVNLLCGVLFLWLFYRNGKKTRDYVKRLIGEKSKALLEKIKIAAPQGPMPDFA